MTTKGVRNVFLTIIVLPMVAMTMGCYPVLKKEAQRPEEALKQIRLFSPGFRDDMDVDSLALAIRRSVEYLDRLSPETVFHYGLDAFTSEHVRESHEAFLDLLAREPDPDNLSIEIRRRFRIYRATGRNGDRRVSPDHLFRLVLNRLS